MALTSMATIWSASANASGAPVTQAISTTTNVTASTGNGACLNGGGSGDPTNCNLYQVKQDVWFSGLPNAAALGDGAYFFAVLEPGGQADPNDGAAGNLSTDDTYNDRTFTIDNGTITNLGTHGFENNELQLAPYADTSNPGGVYILAACKIDDPNSYPVQASDCKYDAFKVIGNTPPDGGGSPAAEPAITKDAAGAYTTTWNWGITKVADKTSVTKVGPSHATFSYVVSVTHDGGTDSNVTVSGTIDVQNPNFDAFFNTVPVTVNGVTDQLSDGTDCDVDVSAGLTLTAFDQFYPYTCTLDAVPTGQLDNTASVSWDAQTLDNGTDLTAGSANFIFAAVAFTQTKIDDAVAVTDTYAGPLGTLTAADPSPTEFGYDRTVAVPGSGCANYDNTATFTTNTVEATGSASATVAACGIPSGALTMGFWQNKNGQAIITGANQAPLGTWLKGYAPFSDLTSPIAKYVTNVIKAANASGASMNAILKAQMLATALDVYFSNVALGGNKLGASTPIGGLVVDLTAVCKNIPTCTIAEITSASFGGAAQLSVSDLLTYAASQSNAGGSAWYGQVKATQELAKDTFDAINNGVAMLI